MSIYQKIRSAVALKVSHFIVDPSKFNVLILCKSEVRHDDVLKVPSVEFGGGALFLTAEHSREKKKQQHSDSAFKRVLYI